MASHGQAVARAPDGKVVFVSGAMPGELVRAELTDDRSRYSSARTLEVVEPSPDRVVPPCPKVAEGCGGCQWQHIALPAQRLLKERIIDETLRRLGHLDPPPSSPTVELEPWAYRTTLRAGVVDGRAALRQLRSNELTHVEGCLVVHPLLAELLEGSRYGQAREVVLRCGANTGERLAASIPSGRQLDVPGDVRRDWLHEQVAGRRWRVSARSFFQTRTDGVDALAHLVKAAAEGVARAAGRAADLYSGVGVFAGVLADAGWSVVAVESAPSAVDDARANLESFEVEIVKGDVGRWAAQPADLVVADPSRDGLGRAAVSVVQATGAKRVVLISCDAGSLGRNAGLLASEGYRLTSVTPVDLFPHTFHVEVVTVWDRHIGHDY